jgi:hypothetical protein
MADIIELTPEQQAELEAWIAERPPVVQEAVRSHPPTKLYRLTDTNQRVTISAYNEDGTVQVIVAGKYNAVVFDRQVFGIPLSALTECELPGPEEQTGTALTHPLDVQIFVDATRPLVLNDQQKARLVKELHDKTGKGLMASKLVLIAHDWDIEAAIATLLREHGERHRW